MIRRLLRDFILAIVMVCAALVLVHTLLGESLDNSPVNAVSEWSRDRAVADRVSQLDGTVTATLRVMDFEPEALVEWQRENPESVLRRLWSMDPANQKNASVIALYILHQNRNVDPLTAWREAVSFVHYSHKYDVPLTLAVAVGNTESHFDPKARSSYGAAGVMQVVWRVHSHLLMAHAGLKAEGDLYHPEKGVSAGVLLLSRYMKAYGSTKRALGRYCGGGVDRYWAKVNRGMKQVVSYGLNPEI